MNKYVFVPIAALSFRMAHLCVCDLSQYPTAGECLLKDVVFLVPGNSDALGKLPAVAKQT
jgi:hypothetical protein